MRVATILIPALLILGGCSSVALYDGTAHVVDASGVDRDRVIESTREVLGRAGYEIERVDATRGVVTTLPKPSFGSALVGRGDGGVKRLLSETMNEHEHRVRVDIGDDGEVRVRVFVYRIGTPGRRVDTESMRLSTRSSVIGPDGGALPASVSTPIGQDGELAASLGARIERALTRG